MGLGKCVLTLSLTGALAAAPSTAIAATPKNEPYFGRYNTICPVPDTSDRHGHKGGMTSSDPSDADRSLVDRFVNDPDVTANSSYIANTNLSNDTIVSCKAAITTLISDKNCFAYPLHLLGDGEIRKSWACFGAYAYDMYFTIDHGQISNIWAKDDYTSPVPVVVIRQ